MLTDAAVAVCAQTPARFADVSGLNVFDLDAFLDMAQKTYKWQCPQTMKNSSIEVGGPNRCAPGSL